MKLPFGCLRIKRAAGKDAAVLLPADAVPAAGAKPTATEIIGGFRELQQAQLDRGFKPLRGEEIKRFITEGRQR